MAMDYSRMWEAFVGGEWGAGSPGALTEGGMAQDPYQQRVESFYSEVVGPAFGYLGEKGFGEEYTERFSIGGERDALELAERQFRLAIGDPYGGDDPFAWETLSRYATGEDPLTEAQKLLKGELFDKGGLLGGETGSAYGLSMEGQTEAYTIGMAGQREGLGGSLTAGAGLASGTSGATLRSGAAVSQAEDVLSEAYKKSRGLSETYKLGKAGTEKQLKEDLQDAFDTYTGVIQEEKKDFLSNILSDVQLIQGLVAGMPEKGKAFTTLEGTTAETAFGVGSAKEKFEAIEAGADWGGLTYDESAVSGFREDGACGIGELYILNDPEDPSKGYSCQVDPELGLGRNPYEELYGEGEGYGELYDCNGVFGGSAKVDECGVCEGPGPEENYDCSGTCTNMDCTGACGGTTQVDACGECGGDGSTCAEEGCGPGAGAPSYICPQDGAVVCDESECVYGPAQVDCPPGDPMCDPAGDPTCGEGYTYNPHSGQCDSTGGCTSGLVMAPNGVDCLPPWDIASGYTNLHCPDGTWAPAGDFHDPYRYCPPYDPGGDNPWTQVVEEDELADCTCATRGAYDPRYKSGYAQYVVCDDRNDSRHGKSCGEGLVDDEAVDPGVTAQPHAGN